MPGVIGPFYDAVTLGLTRTASGSSGRFVWFPGSRFDNFGEYRAIINRLNNQDAASITFGFSKRLIIVAHGASNITTGYVKTPSSQLIGFFSEPASLYTASYGTITLSLVQAPWGIQWSKGADVESERLADIGVSANACDEYYFDAILGEDYPGTSGSGQLLVDLEALIINPNKVAVSLAGSTYGYASSKKLNFGAVNFEDFHEFHEKSHRDCFGELLVQMVSAFQKTFYVPHQILPFCSAVTADVLLVDCRTSVSEVVTALNNLGIIYAEILVSACRGFLVPQQERWWPWPEPTTSISSVHVASAKSRRMTVGDRLFLAESSLSHIIEFWRLFKIICEKLHRRRMQIIRSKTRIIPELPGVVVDLSREDEGLAWHACFDFASSILSTYTSIKQAVVERQSL